MVAFLLILIGIFIVFINVKAIKKDKLSFKDTLNGSVDNIDEYKEEIGLIRIEFAETLVDIQKEMEYLKKELNILKESYDNNKVSDLTENNDKENNKTIKVVTKEQNNEKHIHKKETYKTKEQKEENLKEEKKSLEEPLKENVKEENSIKVSEVNKLLKKGCSIEQIAEQLHIGKGEVILIKELYSK